MLRWPPEQENTVGNPATLNKKNTDFTAERYLTLSVPRTNGSSNNVCSRCATDEISSNMLLYCKMNVQTFLRLVQLSDSMHNVCAVRICLNKTKKKSTRLHSLHSARVPRPHLRVQRTVAAAGQCAQRRE